MEEEKIERDSTETNPLLGESEGFGLPAQLPEILTYKNAFLKVLNLAGPFTLSRLSVAINGIGNGILLKYIDSTAVAAGPLITAFTYGVMGTMRGMILATGILVGEANGAGKKSEVSRILRQSWFFGSMLSIPSIALLLNSKNILTIAGVDEDISKSVQRYFFAFSFGIPPTFWLASDQQLSLGIKRSNVTLVAGSVYSGLTMITGYPLALGAFGLPKLGTAGLGYGASFAAWTTLAGLRLYYNYSEYYKDLDLFSVRCNGVLENISGFIKVGVPLGLQRAMEWGNLAAITLMIGSLGENALTAEQVSLQPMSAYNLILLGLAQATGVGIANLLGEKHRAVENEDFNSATILEKNAKMFGNTSIMVALISSAVMLLLFFSIPEQLSYLFIDTSADDKKEILSLAKTILYINGVGLLFDSVRNVGAGSLRGFKDVVFAPSVSFIFMSIIGLTMGGSFSLVAGWGAEWLFITRSVAMLLSAFLIGYRWLKKIESVIPERLETFDQYSDTKGLREVSDKTSLPVTDFFKNKQKPRDEEMVVESIDSRDEGARL